MQGKMVMDVIYTSMDMLNKWQTLIGAFSGGILGVVGAAIMAYNQKKREDRASAQIIHSELSSFCNAVTRIDNLLQNLDGYDQLTEAKKDEKFLDEYISNYPIPSPLFEATYAQMLNINPKLSKCLREFKIIYSPVIIALQEVRDYFKHNGGVPSQLNDTMKYANAYLWADIQIINNNLHKAAKIAKCIIYYLDNFVLGRHIFFKKYLYFMKSYCFPSSEERECTEFFN